MRTIVRLQKPACMLIAWRVANLLDSLTDSYYAGEIPSISAINEAEATVKKLKECSVPNVDEILTIFNELRKANLVSPDAGKTVASKIRTATQKALESFSLQATL